MVREKDLCWEYGEKLDGNKVKCKFCLRILNGGISRLKHHLSRLPSRGVVPCTKVRDDVTDRVNAIITMKEEGKSVSSSKRRRLAEAKSPANVPVSKSVMCLEATTVMKPLSSVAQVSPLSSDYDWENAERSIALFFFENKLDLCIARSSSYQLMVDAVAKCGHGFRGPSSMALKNTWLGRIKTEVSEQSKEMETEWGITGCTIIADSWTDNKSKAIINFSVSSPSGTFFHRSVDASTYFKNIKCMGELFDSVIQEFGQENVIQVIIDNTLNCVGVGSYIMQNYDTVFVTPCASNCLSLILEDISKIDWVNSCIIHAQSISKFIYNHTWVLDLMRKFTGGQELVRTSITKSASDFLSLQCMLKLRPRLKHMFNSPEYLSNPAYLNKPQSISCATFLEDNDFWKAVEESVAVSEPLLRVMREVSGGKPFVGSIYDSMTKAMESIRTYYIMDENKCKVFLDIVDKRWKNQLHSPLHAAAAFLNPSIQYNPDIKFLGHVKEEFLNVLEKLLPTPESRHDITEQIIYFKKAQGMFGNNLAREARNTISPGLWWEQYGDSAPGLQRVAVRILSQVCSGSIFENWSAFQNIHTEKRNRLDKETLNDIIYINSNLKLASRMKVKPAETDPLLSDEIDMTSDWVEETESPSSSQWLDRFGSTLEGSDLNTRQFTNAMFGASDHIFGL